MQFLIVPFLHLSFNISLWAFFVCPVSRQLLSVTLHLSMLTPPCRSLTSGASSVSDGSDIVS